MKKMTWLLCIAIIAVTGILIGFTDLPLKPHALAWGCKRCMSLS